MLYSSTSPCIKLKSGNDFQFELNSLSDFTFEVQIILVIETKYPNYFGYCSDNLNNSFAEEGICRKCKISL